MVSLWKRIGCQLGRSSFTKFAVLPRSCSGSSGSSPEPSGLAQKFWAWTTQARPHWRESPKEAAVLFCVFGVTGSSSVAMVRPIFKSVTGIEGNMKDGPWSYRIGSLLMVSPVYACVLITVGTLSGRHTYFAKMGGKILGRFVPSSFKPKIQCSPAKKKASQSPQSPNDP
eukprot:gnl/MRDRNA2_/MRDRNA2_28969_c0_seq1.p1 gnl/MRDRNA2_/MRDRNA2_28969_c0~~gnl/MRDRNA2_/MRDRNA2_28969_c0_seq1.p1  ORF type:complete len:170 (+),score=25.84 gnl/MRDRNA2_/MRDRNA2_28969_c0_seq1:79-588(+)